MSPSASEAMIYWEKTVVGGMRTKTQAFSATLETMKLDAALKRIALAWPMSAEEGLPLVEVAQRRNAYATRKRR